MRLRAMSLPTGEFLLVGDRIKDGDHVRAYGEDSEGASKRIAGCAGLVFFSEEIELPGDPILPLSIVDLAEPVDGD